jgi:DNA-binding XRE family transcriptional regulator
MRKKQDLTQIELANKLNVSRKTIIDIENVKTNP